MTRVYQIDEEGRRYCQPGFGLVGQPPFWPDQPVGIALTVSVDMTDADSFRKEMSEKYKTHITINSLIIKAAADVLEDFPIMSGMWLGKDKIQVPNPGEVCILYTIQAEDSIEVNWLEKVGQKSLLEISSELNAQIKEAKSKNKPSTEERKPPEPLFYLANIGTMGPIEVVSSNWFPPNITGELVVGAMLEKPAVKDNKFQIRKMMNVISLFDHRAMIANIPTEFLTQLKRNLEEPAAYLA
jgi:pyruvate/2-oxoglutarate dehydrogenase complex dihydrolipoamide acyltransferase (E2) component